MKNSLICLFISILISNSILTSAQMSNKEQIQNTIQSFFEGMKKGDTTIIKAQLYESCQLGTVGLKNTGEGTLSQLPISKFISSIGNKPSDQVYDERITLYDIKIDQNMAIAWTPYRFYLNDNFSHCGVNVFSLIKDGEIWKIFNIVDTRTKTDCD